MQNPRFRLFGGPNGSGKTHVFDKFKEEGYIHTEIYVNADKIESELKESRRFSFNAYRVKVDNKGFKEYIIGSGLYQTKLKDKTILDQFVIRSGVLRIGSGIKSILTTLLLSPLILLKGFLQPGNLLHLKQSCRTSRRFKCLTQHIQWDIGLIYILSLQIPLKQMSHAFN